MSVPPPLPIRPGSPAEQSYAAQDTEQRRGEDAARAIGLAALAVIGLLLLLCLVGGFSLWARGRSDSVGDGSEAIASAGDNIRDEGDDDTRHDARTSEEESSEAPQPKARPPSEKSEKEAEDEAPVEVAFSDDASDPKTSAPGPVGTGHSGMSERPKGHSVAGGSFFGLRAPGQKFVYVIDCSSSMSGQPLARAKRELFESLKELSPKQEFFIIFFASDMYPMFYPAPMTDFQVATDEVLAQVEQWLAAMNESGGTEPLPALEDAVAREPDAVFFLTDGAIPDVVADSITVANAGRIPIHTIGFMNSGGELALREIADRNDGKYRFVP